MIQIYIPPFLFHLLGLGDLPVPPSQSLKIKFQLPSGISVIQTFVRNLDFFSTLQDYNLKPTTIILPGIKNKRTTLKITYKIRLKY